MSVFLALWTGLWAFVSVCLILRFCVLAQRTLIGRSYIHTTRTLTGHSKCSLSVPKDAHYLSIYYHLGRFLCVICKKLCVSSPVFMRVPRLSAIIFTFFSQKACNYKNLVSTSNHHHDY